MNNRVLETLRFDAPGDHIVVINGDGRRLLLDTGSPISIGDGAFSLLGRSHPFAGPPPGFDLAALGAQVGMPLDGLLGNDVLAGIPFTIDWGGHTLEFLDHFTNAGGMDVALGINGGIPFVDCEVAGRRSRALVDTGAVISFLNQDDRVLPAPVGETHEFHLGPAGIIQFDTPLWKLPVTCGRDFEATFGCLPPAFSAVLRQLGVEVILGADLWKRFRVTLDMNGGQMNLN